MRAREGEGRPGQGLLRLPGRGKTIVIGRNAVTWKATADDTDGAFSVIEYTVAPGFNAPALHANTREAWAGYVLEGTLGFELDKRRLRAPAGSFVFFPKGQPFTWWNPESTSARWLVIYCPAGFEGYFEEVSRIIRRAGARDRNGLASLWMKYGMVDSALTPTRASPRGRSRPAAARARQRSLSPASKK